MNDIIPIEFKDQRVMTTKVLAEAYGTDEKIISNNFNRNIERFIAGKHYYKLEGEELKEFKGCHLNDESLKYVSILYLWTDRGAARHAKILDTDEAWQVYEALEDTYFRVKENKLNQPLQIDSKFLYQIAAQLEEKEKQIAILTPKAEYFDDLVDRNLLTSFRDTAKELKVQESKFIEWLIGNGYVYRDKKKKLCSYAQYVGKLFEVKEWKNDVKAGNQTLITPRGRETFRLLLIKDGLIKEEI